MIFFLVTDNINVKLSDGELVKYTKLTNPDEIVIDNVYCASFDEVESLKEIFKKVGKKYNIKILKEKIVKEHKSFPIELGIKNLEYNLVDSSDKKLLDFHDKSFLLNEEFEKIDEKLVDSKDLIRVAIFGGVGRNIGEIISSLGAIRLLHEYLNNRYQLATIDVFIEANENKFYQRDKELLEMNQYITTVLPMGCSVKDFIKYDYFIDTSSVNKLSFYEKMPYIDAYLYKFGMDYQNINSLKKYNEIDLRAHKPSLELKQKIEKLKKKGKLLLFHPFSADASRSMPEEIAGKFINELCDVQNEYIVISTLKINGLKYKNYEDLTNYSKTVFDFAYIISQMDRVISVDTSAYHISEAFFIPTIVFFVTKDYEKRVKYYHCIKAIYLKDKKKLLSKFSYENEALTLYKHDAWKSIKISKIIKLLHN